MNKEQIQNMIDKKISKLILEDKKIYDIIDEIKNSQNNINKILVRDNLNISEFQNSKFEEITPIRIRYAVYYLKFCEKRIDDIRTFNAYRVTRTPYKGMSNLKLFNLIKFRDQLIGEK